VPVTVTLDGQTVRPQYAGKPQSRLAGVMQINVQIPSGVSGNAVPVTVQVGTASSQAGVTIAVR